LNWWRKFISGQEIGVFLVLVVMVLYLTYKTDTFTTSQNLQNVFLSFSWIAIAAFGQTLVIITAGIDLSVGSVMALSGLAAAYAISGSIEGEETSWAVEKVINGRAQMVGPDGWVIPSLFFGCLMGLFLGTVNGALVAWANLPPFIATLGMMSMARGVCYGWSSGWPFQKLNDNFRTIGQGELALGGYDIPYPTMVMIALAILMTIFLNRTIWGYRIYAVGGNEQATRLSGINVRRTKLLTYMASGLMGGIGGTLMTARLGVAAPTAATGYELDVIAAVVIGGTSLMGGKGTILGTLIGAAIMQVLRNGLNLLGYDPYWQPAAIGAVIILAISFDQLRQWFQGRRLYDVLEFDAVPGWANRDRIGRIGPVSRLFTVGFFAAGAFFLAWAASWLLAGVALLIFPIGVDLQGPLGLYIPGGILVGGYLTAVAFGLAEMRRWSWVMAFAAIGMVGLGFIINALSLDLVEFGMLAAAIAIPSLVLWALTAEEPRNRVIAIGSVVLVTLGLAALFTQAGDLALAVQTAGQIILAGFALLWLWMYRWRFV